MKTIDKLKKSVIIRWSKSQVPPFLSYTTKNKQIKWFFVQHNKNRTMVRKPTKPTKVFLISNNSFTIPAMKIFMEKNNGKLVGTQSDLKTIPLDRSIKKTEAEILIISTDVENVDHQLINEIQVKQPKIKVITILKETEGIQELMVRTTIPAFLLIDEGFDELIRAIKAVKRGQSYYSPKVTRVMGQRLKKEYHILTPRETDILILSILEIDRAGISEMLQIGRATVRSHIRNINSKLGTKAITA